MKFSVFAALLASASVLATPAFAQSEAEVEALREEIARLRAQLDGMEAQLSKMGAPQPQSAQPAEVVAAPPPPAPVSPKAEEPQTAIAWKGAPELASGDGKTFKPRGRLQLDSNVVARPEGINAPTLGWSSDVRRAYLGAEGDLGAGFGYRMEVDFASGDVQFTDAWLTYEKGPLTLTLGHHRITSLDDLTSDLETSFLERPAFTQAFGFERRLGFSANYKRGDVQLTAGLFADDLTTLGTSGQTTNSFSLDGRAVYMPKIAQTQLHLGGSLHYRELNDLSPTLRYRARPGARTTEIRFVDTGMFSAESETGYGVEFAAIRGPFHAAAEGYWQHVARPSLASSRYFGGYGELGYVFAGGTTRGYRNGTFSSIKPSRGVDQGGSGAWQVNLRYDWLDLDDRAISGGRQETLGASLIWVPMEHLKFLANYLRVNVSDTPVMAGPRSDYSSNVFGLRAQYDF